MLLQRVIGVNTRFSDCNSLVKVMQRESCLSLNHAKFHSSMEMEASSSMFVRATLLQSLLQAMYV